MEHDREEETRDAIDAGLAKVQVLEFGLLELLSRTCKIRFAAGFVRGASTTARQANARR